MFLSDFSENRGKEKIKQIKRNIIQIFRKKLGDNRLIVISDYREPNPYRARRNPGMAISIDKKLLPDKLTPYSTSVLIDVVRSGHMARRNYLEMLGSGRIKVYVTIDPNEVKISVWSLNDGFFSYLYSDKERPVVELGNYLTLNVYEVYEGIELKD